MLVGGRFQIRRRLGEGGMGVVYEALDEKRQVAVALKTLTRLDAAGIYRLKGEFRSLASVLHPNLVRLRELFADGDQWFFTMDLIVGRPFLEYVRSDSALDNNGRFLEQPLRDALKQLAAGVQAIHYEGKLHRDLKPPNVLVTHDARVVILDFGLVSSQTDKPIGETAEDVISGTPAYMAPEQASGERALPASDWYAVGVMLYEALTGQIPFTGPIRKILFAKRTADPVPPSHLCPGIPEDLDALCMSLLDRDPVRRATGADVMKAVGDPKPASTVAASAEGTIFVGRSEELRHLEVAWKTTRAGAPSVVLMSGPSGVGKTALAQRFLAERTRVSGTLTLHGRCHEREFVPFKAFDGVIDELGRHLRTLPRERAAELLPRDIHALARVFPTLRRVEAVTSATSRDAQQLEDGILRRRAFVALKDLFCKLCDRESVAVFVDDLQWGDEDSAVLLAELVGPPDPPALLFLGCYRDDGEATELVRRSLALGKSGSCVEVKQLRVGPLGADEAAHLARRMLDPHGGTGASAHSAEIARESNGLPYFVAELVRFSQARLANEPGHRMASLHEVVAARAAALPEGAQRLLEVISLAGRVIALDLAAQVARVTRPHGAVETLIAAKLVRRTGSTSDGVIAYHDRVRETISEALDPGRARELYEHLALAIEATGQPEAEWLCELYQQAGMRQRAGAHAIEAGDQAAEGLAFRRAATHYRFALDHADLDPKERSTLYRKLGEVLGNAGLSSEAAGAYEAAIQGARPEDILELERLSGEQFVRAGRVEEGLRAFRNVLHDAGVSLPHSTPGVMAALLATRARLRLRGLRYTLRDERDVPRALMRRVHALRAVYPIGGRDPVLGALVMSKYAIAALDSGVADHVMHVIAGEGIYAAVFGGPTGERMVESVRPEVLRLEQTLPTGAFRTRYFEGITAFLLGRWRAAAKAVTELEALAEEQLATGGAWELHDLVAKACASQLYLGDINHVRARVPALIRAARERCDDQALEQLLGVAATLELASDRPDVARDVLLELDTLWTARAFSATRLSGVIARAQRLLYLRDPGAAHAFLEGEWPRYQRSGMSRVQIARVRLHACFAGCALARAARQRTPVSGRTRRLVHSLTKESLSWPRGLALLTQAGLAFCDGRGTQASDLLEQAANAFDLADMKMDAACCRHRRGILVRGAEGEKLVRDADRLLRDAGIQNPTAWAAMSTPGFDGEDSQGLS
jgi:hypothetical protein